MSVRTRLVWLVRTNEADAACGSADEERPARHVTDEDAYRAHDMSDWPPCGQGAKSVILSRQMLIASKTPARVIFAPKIPLA